MNNKLMVVCALAVFAAIAYYYSTHTALILILEAVVFVELFRPLWSFAFEDEGRIKLRYVIDGGFVFLFKEFYLACILIKKDLLMGGTLMVAFLAAMFFVVWLRKLLMKVSPTLMED